jgi:argininosuccinate lyase
MYILFEGCYQRFKEQVKALFDLMMESAEKQMFCCQVIPIYKSRFSSFGMWFSAYAESLIDDITMLNAAPDGCGPKPIGFRSGLQFVPDRQNLYHKEWAETLKYNAVAAQMSRGKSEKNPGFAMVVLPPP